MAIPKRTHENEPSVDAASEYYRPSGVLRSSKLIRQVGDEVGQDAGRINA
jgi:hypothetical protein